MGRNILLAGDGSQISSELGHLIADHGYRVIMARNTDEALDIIENEAIHMIIADMRVPRATGYQLLKTAKKKYPAILRFILIGYADEETVLRALGQNLAKLYICKPWDNKELMGTIDNLFETESTLRDESILALLNNLEELPALSNTYTRLCNAIDQDIDIDKIAAIIEEDQSVAAKVLHIANSAFYGVKTGSIAQATLFLGLANIKNTVLTTTICGAGSKMGQKSDSSKKLLWEHAYLCNKGVTLLYERLHRKKLPNIYLSAGLLHDIGKLIMLHNFSDRYAPLLEEASSRGEDYLLKAETETFTASHQEIGGYLLNWWELPHPIVEAALYHHSPLEKVVMNKELVSVVNIVDVMVWKLMGHTRNDSLNKDVLAFLHLSEEDCWDTLAGIKP